MRANVDQEGVARSWRERGFSCGLWVDPPGQVWADYVHDVDGLVMVVEDPDGNSVGIMSAIDESQRRPPPPPPRT